MRVLVVTPAIPEADGASGGAIAAHALVGALALRHEVVVAALSPGNARVDEALAKLQSDLVEAHAVTAPWPGRLRLTPRWMLGRDPMRVLQYRHAPMQDLIDRLAASRRFDVIHVLNAVMGAYRYPPGVPQLLTEEDADIPSPMPSLLRACDLRRRTSHQRRVWQSFDQVQVYSDRDAAVIRSSARDLGARVRVNPLAVGLPEVDDHVVELPATIVFVGQFMHPPNVDAAVWLVGAILPLVRDRLPDVELQIVGAFPPPAVRRLAGGGVSVTGRVPSVRPYIARASLVVAPLRSGGGVRLKVLEAMALAKAVVTTPLGASGIVPAPDGDRGLVVASNADDFAEAIVALLRDAKRRADLGRRARMRVAADHSYDSLARRLETLYAELRPPAEPGR